MTDLRKNLSRGFKLVFIGYIVGLLTSPKSGKQNRQRVKKGVETAGNDIEKELKSIYSDTKVALDKLAKDNPELSKTVKDASVTAQKSQVKVKQLLSAIHGQDNVDDDLESALKSAKSALKDLKNYLSK